MKKVILLVLFFLCVLAGCHTDDSMFYMSLWTGNMEGMHEAAEKGENLDSVKANSQTKNPILIILADAPKKIEGVSCLLKLGADPNYTDSSDVSLLMYAAGNGQGIVSNPEGLCDLLLAYGADIALEDHNGKTALDYAAQYANNDAIDSLLSAGAKVTSGTVMLALLELEPQAYQCIAARKIVRAADRTDTEDVSPIILAAIEGETEKTIELIASSTEAECAQAVYYVSAFCKSEALAELCTQISIEQSKMEMLLKLAIQAGNLDIVQYIIDILNYGDHDLSYLLETAVIANQYYVVEYLLKKGADPVPDLYHGYNTVLDAAENGNIEMIALLIQYGYPVDDQNAVYFALKGAIDKGEIEPFSFFYEAGFDFNTRIGLNETLLSLACSAGQLEIVRFILQHGGTLVAESGYMPDAASSGNTELVLYLLQEGGNPNDRKLSTDGTYEASALVRAIRYGYYDIVQILVEYGADLEMESNDGNTAVYEAATHPSTHILQYLIDQGAKVNHKNSSGSTALSAAYSYFGRSSSIVQILVDAGAIE